MELFNVEYIIADVGFDMNELDMLIMIWPLNL